LNVPGAGWDVRSYWSGDMAETALGAYETGKSKRDLVIDAVRQTYRKNPDV
jgi:hypothetical protein